MSKRKNKQQGRLKRRVAFIGSLLAVLGLGFVILAPRTPQAPTEPTFTLDARLQELAKEVGINEQHLVEAKATIDKPAICVRGNGCFLEQTIYIYPETTKDPTKFRVSLAWEYMRYVRNVKATDKPDALVKDFYQRNKMMVDVILANYEPKDINTEAYLDTVHALACSAVSDSRLGTELTNYCNKWVKTSALPDYIR